MLHGGAGEPLGHRPHLVGVHINPAYRKDGRFDTAAAGATHQAGYRGNDVEVSTLFEMLRPEA